MKINKLFSLLVLLNWPYNWAIFANTPPTNVHSSGSLSINENQPIGSIVGEFNATDPDVNSTLTYYMVAGAGDTHNSLFTLATVRATRDLNVNGLKWSREIPSILMEATTIRLSDVNFPASSMVRLNSLKGAIDGKYPNFGTAVANAQQIGRVNFIKNVSSGGNVMNNRQNFDQFGGNISIGKVALP